MGTVDFNRVALIEQNLVQQQDLQAQSYGEIAQGLIQIYRALGGGWEIGPFGGGSGVVGQLPAVITPADDVPAPPSDVRPGPGEKLPPAPMPPAEPLPAPVPSKTPPASPPRSAAQAAPLAMR